jgi:tetratricopeptide (TPR) repeat protein
MSISLSRISLGRVFFRRLPAGLRRVPPATFVGNCNGHQLDMHLPSFVQPAATRSASSRLAGILRARRGLYLRLDHGLAQAGKPEVRMMKSTIKLATLALFSVALIASPPSVPAFAAGGGGDPPSATPPPPPPPGYRPAARSSSKVKKKPTKQSSADDDAFRQGYRAAHATIYERNDYAAAIDQLKALGHDDNAGVANLIGYSYRKLGDYRLSQVWYERALKTDPNHVLTWQYYGLWQIEQGNRDQASYHLSRIAAICGTGCDEYRSLAAALEKPPGTGLVY